MANPFDIFFTSRVSVRKADGTRLENLKSSVGDDTIAISDASLPIDEGDIVVHHLPNGSDHLYEVYTVRLNEGIEGTIPSSLELSCRKLPTPVFGRHGRVTIVRDAGAQTEKRWQTTMGGDLRHKALFHLDDRVRTGDELHAEYFDEPRVIARVDPCGTNNGISHWEAQMVSQSEWKRCHAQSQPYVVVSGEGARVNVNSIDQSVQHFHGLDYEAISRVLDDMKSTIVQAVLSEDEKNDAAIDIEQLRGELRRSRPDGSRLRALLDRLQTLAGLAEITSRLISLLRPLLPM